MFKKYKLSTVLCFFVFWIWKICRRVFQVRPECAHASVKSINLIIILFPSLVLLTVLSFSAGNHHGGGPSRGNRLFVASHPCQVWGAEPRFVQENLGGEIRKKKDGGKTLGERKNGVEKSFSKSLGFFRTPSLEWNGLRITKGLTYYAVGWIV